MSTPEKPEHPVAAEIGGVLERLEAADVEGAVVRLRALLTGELLSRGYPVRQLVSAAHGLLRLLPDPHPREAQGCLRRALDLLAQEEPGQTRLF